MRIICVVRLLLAVLALVGLPDATIAQPAGKTARVGWIAIGPESGRARAFLDAFREGMRERGWVEGRNLVVESRWGDREMAAGHAAELVQAKIDIIVAQGPAVFGVRAAAGTTPVLFSYSGDPVEAKLVSSLARPGGNLTGMSLLGFDLVGKRLEVLKEAVPGITRVAILANPEHPGEGTERAVSRAAAQRLGLAVQYLPVRAARDFDGAFEAIVRERADAIVAFPDGLMISQAAAIAEFAARRRIPAISGWADFADAGNLMSYGPHLRETWRYIAGYADRILRGAKPGDLPVELPSKLELVVNLRVARALNLTLPPSLLARADRIIE